MLRHFVDAAQSTTAEQLLQVFDHFHCMNLRLVELFHTLPHPRDADLFGPGAATPAR